MTEDERQIAAALSRCSFLPGIGDKRFSLQMAIRAHHSSPPALSEKQRAYLYALRKKYRRQIDPGTPGADGVPPRSE